MAESAEVATKKVLEHTETYQTDIKRILNLLEEQESRIPSPIKTIPFKHLKQKYIDFNLFHLSIKYIAFCLDLCTKLKNQKIPQHSFHDGMASKTQS